MAKRQSLPEDAVYASIVVPGGVYRTMKAMCAVEGITMRRKIIELLTREFPEEIEIQPRRKRRQPSQLAAQMANDVL